MVKKIKLAIIARDTLPINRPSGATSYLVELLDQLLIKNVDVRVFSVKNKNQLDEYQYNDIKIMKFSNINFLKLKKDISEFAPSRILLYSSISSGTILWIWWLIISITLNNYSQYFYQVTNITSLGNKLIISQLMRRMKHVFITNKQIFINQKLVKNKSTIIYPGVNTHKTIFNKKINNKIKRVGFFGHLTHIKGVDIFLDVAKRMEHLQFFLVAGSSKDKNSKRYEDNMLNLAKNLKNVKCFGFIKNPLEVMRECDVLLLPYRKAGSILGVSQSGIEAIAMGIPIIGTKNISVAPIIEAIDSRLYGSDVLDFIDIIEKINEKKDLPFLSKKAKEVAKRFFDTSSNINKILKGMDEKSV